MKLIILDRDGTINHDTDDYVKSADEWLPLDGALEAIAKLNQAGYSVVIATNQSGIGRGLYDMVALNAMHDKMNRLLREAGGRIDAIFFCPHNPESNAEACNCRKPLPGLFEQIRDRFGVDMTTVPSVGDTLRDLQAAAAVGCPTHLVRTGKSQLKVPSNLPNGTHIHSDLMAFADWLIASSNAISQKPI
jgi:D-glycero-D-manno-heptose 1,7-bisphosphate phosphatase